MLTAAKTKHCRQCGKGFTPWSTTQAVCSPRCAQAEATVARKAKKVAERQQTRARREALKPRQKWLKECEAIINKIVRLRDRHLGCASCDRPASWDGQWHASHFRSVGAASAIRFHLWNIHKACSVCNNHKSGNLEGYIPRMVARFGQDRVDWLYAQNQLATYDIEYLKRLKAVMGRKFKRMERRI